MERESGVTRNIIDKLHSWDIEGDQMEGEIGFSRSFIDVLHSWDIEGNQMEGKVVLIEVSLMKFILRISNEIK